MQVRTAQVQQEGDLQAFGDLMTCMLCSSLLIFPHNNRSYKPASPMFVFLGWNVHPDKRRLVWQYQKHHVYLLPTNLKKINRRRTCHWNCLPISSWQTLRSTWETRWEELQAVGGCYAVFCWLNCIPSKQSIYIKTSLNQEIDGKLHVRCTRCRLRKGKQGQRSISPFAKGIERSGRRKNRGKSLWSSTNLLCYTVHHQSCGLRQVVTGRV